MHDYLDDDVVSVVGNHDHGPDGGAAEHGAQHGVQLAHEGT